MRSAADVSLGGWTDAEVVWSDAELDVAVIRLVGDQVALLRLLGGQARVARVGTAIRQCEAIGFPAASACSDGVRQPEQVSGLLMSAARLRDARRRAPLDVSTSVPDAADRWQGMSGGAVRDEAGRLIAIVEEVHPQRQFRCLFVLPVEDLMSRADFVAACRDVGWAPQLEEASSDATGRIVRARRVAAIRWLSELPDMMEALTTQLREIAFSGEPSGSPAVTLGLQNLDNRFRSFANRFLQVEQGLPGALGSVDLNPSQQGEFAELFPALKREYGKWFWLTEAIRSSLRRGSDPAGTDAVEILTPPVRHLGSDGSVIQELPGSSFPREGSIQAEWIFRSAVELLVALFPPDEQAESGA